MDNKILICDTNRDLVQVLKTILYELTPAHVLSEATIKDVYQRILLDRPDVLIVDLGMPNRNADKLMQDIRHEAGKIELHIISLSATAEGMRLALAAGVDVSLAKPLDLEELLGEVNLALQ
ncbi:response regulator [Sphingobacterium faecale]|uniref:Response regulator n=1 Tax=Sphingobacterium faecale TaxID=2803775 RepID=A0ABS1R2U1_9SPHI|nr:response regulator [Sphingobacterium faecale]MBL1408978.1 response regulator [Sphingobacterium faecale]